jgi:hypothetical protein
MGKKKQEIKAAVKQEAAAVAQKFKAMTKMRPTASEEKKIEKAVVKRVKKRIDFSSIPRQRSLVSTRLDAEKFRARLLALQQMFPMMMGGAVGPSSGENFLDLPVAPMQSMNRGHFTMITSTETVPYIYSFLWCVPAWNAKLYYATGLTSGTNTISAYGTAVDNLYPLASSFVQSVITTGMCLRILNQTPLITAGGEVIAGTVPALLIGDGVSYDTLYNYMQTRQANFPLAQDKCIPWLPSSPNDTQPVDPSSAGLNNATSALFVALKMPVPASGQSSPQVDYENYNSYTVTPLPNFEGVIPAKVQPVDESEFRHAKEILGIQGQNSLPLVDTSQVSSLFMRAAEKLGPAILKYVTGKAGKLSNFISGGISAVSGMFSHPHFRTLACLDKNMPKFVKLALDQGWLPSDYAQLLLKLCEYEVEVDCGRKAIQIKHPSYGAPFVAYENTVDGPFRLPRRVVSHRRNFMDDVSECDDFKCPSPTLSVNRRTSSLPPSGRK